MPCQCDHLLQAATNRSRPLASIRQLDAASTLPCIKILCIRPDHTTTAKAAICPAIRYTLGAERVPNAMNGYRRDTHRTLLRPTHPAGCRQACIRLLLGGWRGGGREEPVQKQRAAHACDMSGERWGEMGRYGEIWGRQRSTSWIAARSRSRVRVRVWLALGLCLGLRLGLE